MKKKPTAADGGYITRENAAKAMRQLADDIAANDDGQLVKLAITVYCVPDDGSVDYDGGVFEVTKDILINIPSLEPASLNEVLRGLGDDAPTRGERHEWYIFFKQIESLEELGLVEVTRLGNRIDTLQLTEIGSERAREALKER